MLIDLENGNTVNAIVITDGTPDTVIRLNGIDRSYSPEMAAEYHEGTGWFTQTEFIKFVRIVITEREALEFAEAHADADIVIKYFPTEEA